MYNKPMHVYNKLWSYSLQLKVSYESVQENKGKNHFNKKILPLQMQWYHQDTIITRLIDGVVYQTVDAQEILLQNLEEKNRHKTHTHTNSPGLLRTCKRMNQLQPINKSFFKVAW